MDVEAVHTYLSCSVGPIIEMLVGKTRQKVMQKRDNRHRRAIQIDTKHESTGSTLLINRTCTVTVQSKRGAQKTCVAIRSTHDRYCCCLSVSVSYRGLSHTTHQPKHVSTHFFLLPPSL